MVYSAWQLYNKHFGKWHSRWANFNAGLSISTIVQHRDQQLHMLLTLYGCKSTYIASRACCLAGSVPDRSTCRHNSRVRQDMACSILTQHWSGAGPGQVRRRTQCEGHCCGPQPHPQSHHCRRWHHYTPPIPLRRPVNL